MTTAVLNKYFSLRFYYLDNRFIFFLDYVYELRSEKNWFSHLLIIHQAKTIKIITGTMVWKCDLN